MKLQALFSSKNTSKKLKCRLLKFLLITLRDDISVMSRHCLFIYRNDTQVLLKLLSALLQRHQAAHLFNPIALRMAKTLWSFGHSECNRVNRPKLQQ